MPDSDQLTLAFTIVGVLVAVVAAYFAYRAIPPKRALVMIATDTRLLSTGTGSSENLAVVHSDFGPLVDPRIVSVTIRNTGRAAITSEMYDGGRPLRVLLQTHVLEVLKDQSSIGGVTRPSVRIGAGASTLEIGPGAVHRGQQLTYELLVDGQPEVNAESPLIDVRFSQEDDDYMKALRDYRRESLSSVIPVLIVVAGFILATRESWR